MRIIFLIIVLLLFPIYAFAADPTVMDGLIAKMLKWAITQDWFQYVIASFGIFKTISIFFPSSWKGSSWYNMTYNIGMKVVNAGALEVGRAKNADDLPLSEANR